MNGAPSAWLPKRLKILRAARSASMRVIGGTVTVDHR